MKQNLFKPILLAIAVLLAAIPLQAQQMVSNNNDDEVNKVDQYAPKYRPNQVIVKFKETSPVDIKSNAKGKFQTSSVANIDKLMNEIGVLEAEQLMPLTGAIKNRAPRKAKAISGREVTEPDLSKLYCLKLDSTIVQSVEEVVERLSAIDDVEFAEPNYLAFIQSTEESTTYQSEPMFSEQWGLNAINMPQLWEMPKTDETRPIIAILDTGVDITHPDLADNIWTNPNEATGADYEDDDNNGYVDDVHGWDFVAGTPIIGNGMDRNGHGTHCAGIAAAVGNNGVGITGANPDALIMPIKVMGDDGIGDIATICRGIDYATAAGAHVLSMSIGGGPSAAEYQALCKTLTNYAVLVGAAGNNGNSIYSATGLSFPGAYDIVLGVMASNSYGQLAAFSNYDPDGPFFSKYNMDKAFSTDVTWNDEMMWNYDVMAPGVGITSTYLNGSYKSLNGTSMATPMVAGAISRILQVKGYDYARDYGLMGDMAIAKDGGLSDLAVFNAYQAASYNETNRQVVITMTALDIDDSEGDGDGRFDAGETISIWPTIRSLWGHAENIKIAIEPYDENTPTDAIEVLDNNVDFGWSLNSRGSFKSKNPIRVHVNENAYDGMHLPYKIVITSDNLMAGVEQEHVFEVENGVEIGGLITEDMTLYPDKNYKLISDLGIKDGVTLTILPGTIIDFNGNRMITTNNSTRGKVIAKGSPTEMILFKGVSRLYLPCESDNDKDRVLEYVEIKDYFPNNYTYSARDAFSAENCVINSTTDDRWISENNELNLLSKNNLYIQTTIQKSSSLSSLYVGQANNLLNFGFGGTAITNYCINNNINVHGSVQAILGDDLYVSPNYYFSSNPSIVKNKIAYSPLFDVHFDNILKRPVSEAHGIVWKVVVDGYDAQDEFDLLPPLGVGRHKFEVYYNRDDMDTTITPVLAMGVRPPYTQIGIAEDGFWSVKDSVSVYTAYLNITGKLQADGLNRIYVSGAQDGEHFEIPYENLRFNVLVQAAGSMATGFEAEAGLGKVNLTWNNENNDFEDAMGFNVYRYTMLNDSVAGDTIRLNQTILDIEATEYTDYEVTPGETYYYYYKVLSTDLKEYDISNVVAATPLTSTLGDANASGEVDVADVITTVNYAAGMEPRPFIFEAADVNVDTEIDILDVIGIIKLITNPSANVTAMAEAEAIYSVENGVVYVDCPVELAGVQVMLNATHDATITPTEELNGFERVGAWLGENSYVFLAYNMADRTIPAGKHALLTIGDASITDIRLADKQGHNVLAYVATPTVINVIPADGKAVRNPGIYDLMGRKISSQASDLDRLAPGIYIVNGQKVVR